MISPVIAIWLELASIHDSMVHIVHPPKFNIAPEQSFLGEYCPCGKVYFKGYVKLPGCTRV